MTVAPKGLVHCPPTAYTEQERTLLAYIDAQAQEIERLKSENTRLLSDVTRPESTEMTLMQPLAQSRGEEIERLRADAARYRWLKKHPQWLGWEHDFRPDEVEREVDAAMRENTMTELTNRQIDAAWDSAPDRQGVARGRSRYDIARAIIAADRAQQSARHAEELAAYDLTVSNLRAQRVPDGLIDVLRGGKQCDEDGTEIIMSRQACCEAADILEELSAAPAPQAQPEQSSLFCGVCNRSTSMGCSLEDCPIPGSPAQPAQQEQPQPARKPITDARLVEIATHHGLHRLDEAGRIAVLAFADDLLSIGTQPERPSHTEAGLNEAHTTGVVIFPNDQFREAFRGLIDAGDKP